MSAAPEFKPQSVVDLTRPLPLAEISAVLKYAPIHGSFATEVKNQAKEETYMARVQQLSLLMQELDTTEAAYFTLAGCRSASKLEEEGLRVLSALLNVRRPGVEVLKNLHALSSLQRVALLKGKNLWTAPEEDSQDPAPEILDVIQQAVDQGVLQSGLTSLSEGPEAVQWIVESLRRWVARMTLRLSHYETLPDETIELLVSLCLLEIRYTEMRVSKLAEGIDPYDTRWMARLMPVLSRYDQNIEHMRTVVSKITTYEPFNERLGTVEHAMTKGEMDKLIKFLSKDKHGAIGAQLLMAMRENPILDREFLFLISVLHQTAMLRRIFQPDSGPVDLLALMVEGISAYREGNSLDVLLEPELIEQMWPTLATWGVFEREPDRLQLYYKEDRSVEFINIDGTPKLRDIPGPLEESQLSLMELVRSQIHNDSFIVGLLDNGKAAALENPAIIPMITTMSRSIRVLGKIAGTRNLYTGQTNKDVPRLLLQNPCRVPIMTLRKFINVRYVSKTDLAKIAAPNSDVRREVRTEAAAYLKALAAK